MIGTVRLEDKFLFVALVITLLCSSKTTALCAFIQLLFKSIASHVITKISERRKECKASNATFHKVYHSLLIFNSEYVFINHRFETIILNDTVTP